MDLQKELQKIDSRLLVEVSDTDEIKIMLDEPLDEYNPYLIPCPIWSERYGFATVYISKSSLTLEQYRKLVEVISHYKGENYYEPPMPAIPLSFSLTQSDIEEALNRSPWYDVEDYVEIMKLALYPEMELIRFKNISKFYLYHNVLPSMDLSTARGRINFVFDLYNAIKFAYPVAFVAARTLYEREICSEYRMQMFKEFGLLDEYDPEVWEQHFDNQLLDETKGEEKDTMTKENGRTYENIDELNKALKEIDSGLQVRRSFGNLLRIDFFMDPLAVIKRPDSNHLDGYWFQWIAQTDGSRRTSEIIKNVMGIINNLLTQFDTYTPDGFWDCEDKDTQDDED